MNNPEQKALKKLASLSLYDLQTEARRLEEAATAVPKGRLAHGMRTHRQRVSRVLDRKLEQKHYRQEKDIQRHLHQQESPQALYDEGYDQGNYDYRHIGKYSEGILKNRIQREGYHDGYFGKDRKRF